MSSLEKEIALPQINLNPTPCKINLTQHVLPTQLPLCLDVPGVDQPGMVQGPAEHADEDGVFVSSICSDYRSLQKAPEHVQQLLR